VPQAPFPSPAPLCQMLSKFLAALGDSPFCMPASTTAETILASRIPRGNLLKFVRGSKVARLLYYEHTLRVPILPY